ncbi:MAG: DUF111 family protein, partial [Ilumatobacteraceae bacterium]|nr:DUF111 family protein [Ilumatobacteraceae bacterium]
MSRVAWFNCTAGTAGDMTLAALIDAGADSFAVGAIVGGLKIDDYALTFERTQRSGVSATRAIVAVHDHQAEDEHHHRSWSNISQLLQNSELPDRVRARALTVFHVLAEVEAKIHNVNIDDIE